MSACLLSVGLVCFLGSPVTIEIPRAILAYVGVARSQDAEVRFLMWDDEIDDPPVPASRRCVDDHCFFYEAMWIDGTQDRRWTDDRGPFQLHFRVQQDGQSDQTFSINGADRAAVDRLIDKMAVRPEGASRTVPLRRLLVPTD